MMTYDYIAMRGLVKENIAASKLYHARKSALKAAGPKGKGNLREFTRACERQAYQETYDEIRDNPAHAQLQAKYDEIYDRIQQAHEHKP